ncbi:thioredoxin domain-containing protein [Spirosoma koreense]
MAPHASLLSAALQQPVLLVCTSTAPAQHTDVDQFLEKVRLLLNPTVHIVRISETTHPEVVRSFGFTALPAFVLLQQGLELWSYSGPVDAPELVAQLSHQMRQSSLSTR